MPSPIEFVKRQLRNWAKDRGVAIDDDGYTLKRNANLWLPLLPATESEFRIADGDELGGDDVRGKIQALRSSSALAVNVFQYWRDRDASILASALALPVGVVSVRFEQKFPTGLKGKSPNLDVVLTMSDKSIVAIESKFLEPYGPHTSGFRDAYFRCDKKLWGKYGYGHSQKLAEDLRSGAKKFNWLYAEQLLKHILGLSYMPSPSETSAKWQLLYLWYEAPGPAAREHAEEVGEFAGIVAADGIVFKALTYQALFGSLRRHAGASEDEYLTYLGQRYFP
jgi:hypothetical protein